jgi:hypothetical protein
MASSAPNGKDKCSHCGGLHSLVKKSYATAGDYLDCGPDCDYTSFEYWEIDLNECEHYQKELAKVRLEKCISDKYQNVLESIYQAGIRLPSLACYPSTRYEELYCLIGSRGYSIQKFVTHLILKAQTKGCQSRLYRSTPKAVRIAINEYVEYVEYVKP